MERQRRRMYTRSLLNVHLSALIGQDLLDSHTRFLVDVLY